MVSETINQMTNTPLVSLITVNYNGRAFLEELYKSLSGITYSPVEMILVDNASEDKSVRFVRENYPQVKIVENPDNYMFARGNNEGIKAASGDIICLINNDVKVDPDFLTVIVKAFVDNPDMAACQPKVLNLNLPDHFEYAGAAGGFIDKYGFPFMRGRLFFDMEKDDGQYDDIMEVFWSTGACFFIRKSVLDEVGILDEDFRMHMEEIDLCWRMHLLGHHIYCIPHGRVWHQGGGTLSSENPRKIYWNFRNNIFLMVKNLQMFNLIKIIIFRLFMDGIAFLWELFRGKFKNGFSIGKAYIWILLHLPLLMKKRREIQLKRRVGDKEIFRLVYPGSIVWEYFIRGRKKFSELTKLKSLQHLKDKEPEVEWKMGS
jgi:GT2 family glycosyltransferase